MKKNILNSFNVDYVSGKSEQWTGRSSNPDLGIQYWHQAIAFSDINDYEIAQAEIQAYPNSNVQSTIGLLGYQCDEGVRRNFGRVGDAKGPEQVKERLAKLPYHFESKRVIDFGEVICVQEDLESCQAAFAAAICSLITQNIFPIAIGGGHDIAYGHFMGIKEALKNKANAKMGIINFDAHFDLRSVVQKPNSGTPFNQIITSHKQNNDSSGITSVEYFVIGIQKQSNSKELFDIAKKEGVEYVTNFECEPYPEAIKSIHEKLASFIHKQDYLYISIDLDGFSAAYAPGVSAPSPLGFSPHFVYKMLDFIFATKKVISCDIAELNPVFDQDNLTAILAARLVDYIASLK